MYKSIWFIWFRSSTAVCECYSGQLTCPYSPEVKNMQRIFCKRDAHDHNCCTGMAFQTSKETELDQGWISVQDSGNAFTVSVQSLSLGEGMYWCGLRNGTNIIRLAEGEFFNDQMNFEWSIVRWILFLLLPLAVILTHIYCSIKKKQGEKRDE
ncbi:uncharacterized protein si:ch211-102c2.4 [Trichomycterus rosablanca]|uniref:uncharacterized protein si:ch211-102c2.4 n=1 Tax=Trichomycterus rosablanca TaxID=2290929 RepID=UPI002F360A65